MVISLALTLGGFVFVLLLSLDALFDHPARIRMQGVFNLRREKERKSWKQIFRAALGAVRPPPFLDAWVQPKELLWAGFHLDVGEYRAIWWLMVLFGIGVGLLIMVTKEWRGVSLVAALMVMLGIAGSPYLYLHWRMRRRARVIAKSLPDFLDLLTFTVQAGLGFTPALQRVSAGYPGPLGEELRRVLVQIELGFSRAEALDEFVSRSPSPEIQNFVEAVKLTEQLGTSLARTLRIQANMMRLTRRQRAQAAAQTAPIRIIPALVFFFLPSLLLIYLAPPIINFFMRR
ncbi:MAG: type II secretion system F family protein [Anaerolineales bacterium]|nr:type II secretion system F family protein [Anaerolineales bacterium]